MLYLYDDDDAIYRGEEERRKSRVALRQRGLNLEPGTLLCPELREVLHRHADGRLPCALEPRRMNTGWKGGAVAEPNRQLTRLPLSRRRAARQK